MLTFSPFHCVSALQVTLQPRTWFTQTPTCSSVDRQNTAAPVWCHFVELVLKRFFFLMGKWCLGATCWRAKKQALVKKRQSNLGEFNTASALSKDPAHQPIEMKKYNTQGGRILLYYPISVAVEWRSFSLRAKVSVYQIWVNLFLWHFRITKFKSVDVFWLCKNTSA